MSTMINHSPQHRKQGRSPIPSPQKLWGWEKIKAFSELTPLIKKVAVEMARLRYSRADVFAVTLATYEAVSNAIRHGNRGKANAIVRVSYLLTSEQFMIVVEDQGNGFDPTFAVAPRMSDDLGDDWRRGLFFMRAYMTWIRFNSKGNQVTMCKRRSDNLSENR